MSTPRTPCSAEDAAAAAEVRVNLATWFTASALASGLLLASRWERPVSAHLPQLNVGRLALLAAAIGIGLTLLTHRLRLRSLWGKLPRDGALLMLALWGEGTVILASVLTQGHNSAGAFYGYLELAALTTLTVALLLVKPNLSRALLCFAAAGAVIGCAEALLTHDTVNALHGASGRLTGYYGNPNLLGFAGSLAIPLLVVLARGSTRRVLAMTCWGAAAIVLASILLSYSRGALIAMGLGTIAAISLRRPRPRERMRFAATSCALFAVLAAGAYPVYLHLRTHADFALPARAGTPDRSGWDPRAEGLIANGPASLANSSAGSLRIKAKQANEGASLTLGYVSARRWYQTEVWLSSSTTGLEVAVSLEDNLIGAGPVTRTLLLTGKPRRLRVRWQPSKAASNARLYVWLPRGGTATITRLAFGEAGHHGRSLPLRLRGQSSGEAQQRSESRFVHSREDAASLAIRLFSEHPLTGIGWQRFTDYSATRLHYGPLATHDEYLRYAAELGLLGVAFMLLAAVAISRSTLRLPPHDVAIGAAGCVVTGAVGMLFVNALEVPAIAAPLFVSAAVLCTRTAAQGVGSRLD